MAARAESAGCVWGSVESPWPSSLSSIVSTSSPSSLLDHLPLLWFLGSAFLGSSDGKSASPSVSPTWSCVACACVLRRLAAIRPRRDDRDGRVAFDARRAQQHLVQRTDDAAIRISRPPASLLTATAPNRLATPRQRLIPDGHHAWQHCFTSRPPQEKKTDTKAQTPSGMPPAATTPQARPSPKWALVRHYQGELRRH